jgi:hypothetical protein
MARAKAKTKKETYYQRWMKQHIRISFYFDREEYEKLKELASSKNMTVKELLLDLMEGFDKYYEEVYGKGFDSGYESALYELCEYPWNAYNIMRDTVGDREVALFTVPCSVCGKPMVFTHKDENWSSEVRPTLLEAFRRWGHVCCFEVRDGRRASCAHMPTASA